MTSFMLYLCENKLIVKNTQNFYIIFKYLKKSYVIWMLNEINKVNTIELIVTFFTPQTYSVSDI